MQIYKGVNKVIDEKKLIENLKKLLNNKYVSGITYNPYEFGACHALNDAILEVKAQQKIGEWIYCDKGLPELYTDVLVYTIGKRKRVWQLLDHDDEYVWEDEFGGWNEFEEVIAWMPLLSTPYEQGDE